MTYDIVFTQSAGKDFDKLDGETKKRVSSALDRIRIQPDRYITRLVAEPGYRLRVGDYRVILDLENDKLIILVITIRHRRNAYDR
jgi:mRNA interferase RelE/StbE